MFLHVLRLFRVLRGMVQSSGPLCHHRLWLVVADYSKVSLHECLAMRNRTVAALSKQICSQFPTLAFTAYIAISHHVLKQLQRARHVWAPSKHIYTINARPESDDCMSCSCQCLQLRSMPAMICWSTGYLRLALCLAPFAVSCSARETLVQVIDSMPISDGAWWGMKWLLKWSKVRHTGHFATFDNPSRDKY